ncbi:MAG: metallophosphoesterase family protein [Deltaproteobacteria bacterium]|nr:metallophosphoesterase family protein [Deltaproteobacteria bacterium]
MRWALLSDVHGNLEALEAVLADIDAWSGEGVLCAGDIVGYGPDPESCIALLRERGTLAVAGNHEGMVLGRLGFERCVHAGIRAALWTRDTLSPPARRYLADLPPRREIPLDLVVTHGSLGDWQRYLSSAQAADQAIEQLEREHPQAQILVCGHTHAARLYRKGLVWRAPPLDLPLELGADGRWLINPGSVGQSRDERPRARYARYDSTARVVVFRELSYRSDVTLSKLGAAGLVARVHAKPMGFLAARWERLRDRWARWRAPRCGGATAVEPKLPRVFPS